MTESRDPDALIRFLDAGYDDPDRQLALRITNFLGGMDIRQATAVFSLAISMSFRGLEEPDQRTVMRAICEACFRTWAIGRGESEPAPCPKCGGAGTIGNDIEAMTTCSMCGGTGAQ